MTRWNPPASHLGVAETLALFAVSLLALLAALPWLQPLGLVGSAIAQVAFLGLPPVLLSWVRRRPAARALAIRLPSGRAILASVLLGSSLWLVVIFLLLPLVQWLPGAEDMRELQAELAAQPLWLRLVTIAVVPAVCEELLFRGALARALAARVGAPLAIVASAAAFGLFHVTPARILPTAILGIFLGWICLRSGSVIPSMILHFLNNAIVLLVVGAGLAAEVPAGLALLAIAAAFALTISGTVALVRSPGRPS